MPDTDLSALLVSLQLTDSAFPTGFYTLSHGLEGFVQAKQVRPDAVSGLLADLLRHSVGPADATALALAHHSAAQADWDQVARIDHRLHATKLNRELRLAATRTGRQMLNVTRACFGGAMLDRYARLVAESRAPGTQAVVAGVVYAATSVPSRQAVASELFAFAVSLVGAAVRLRLTDHIAAQRLLRDAVPVIEAVSADALDRELADLGGCVPLADIMSARHERAQARMFAS